MKDKVRHDDRLVMVFDICSSTTIIEALLVNGKFSKWRSLIIRIKNFLIEVSKTLDFEVYQFTGDGWILLFTPPNSITEMTEIVTFMTVLSRWFQDKFTDTVFDFLPSTPDYLVGLTFGLDSGPLIKILMNKKDEYVGRPINLACRLQSAIKGIDDNSHRRYKAMLPYWLYSHFKDAFIPTQCEEHEISLTNIYGGKPVRSVLVNITFPPRLAPVPIKKRVQLSSFHDVNPKRPRT